MKNGDQRRRERFTLLLTAEEKKELEARAARARLSASEYARTKLFKKTKGA